MREIKPPKMKYEMEFGIALETEKSRIFHNPGTILVFFDTETTGKNEYRSKETGKKVHKRDPLTDRVLYDEPIEVSAMKCMIQQDGSLSVMDNLEVYIKPTDPRVYDPALFPEEVKGAMEKNK